MLFNRPLNHQSLAYTKMPIYAQLMPKEQHFSIKTLHLPEESEVQDSDFDFYHLLSSFFKIFLTLFSNILLETSIFLNGLKIPGVNFGQIGN